MKKLFLIFALFVFFCMNSFSKEVIAKGKTYTSFGDYIIEVTDDPIIVKGEKLKTFIIKYENFSEPIKVGILKRGKYKNYIVVSDILSVCYNCDKNFFGVDRFDRSLEKLGFVTDDFNLDKSEYFHQKVLGPKENNEVKGTQLIAAFFPRLIKKA